MLPAAPSVVSSGSESVAKQDGGAEGEGCAVEPSFCHLPPRVEVSRWEAAQELQNHPPTMVGSSFLPTLLGRGDTPLLSSHAQSWEQWGASVASSHTCAVRSVRRGSGTS